MTHHRLISEYSANSYIFLIAIYCFYPYLLRCRGNHYVKVVVTIPSEITEKQRELLLEFAKEASKVKEGIGKNAA